MCGIAGLFTSDHRIGPNQIVDLGQRLTTSLAHRGPDNAAVWHTEDGSLILAHTRLAVIDPLARSNQPFLSPDGRYVFVYNGEFYNHQDCRKELVGRWDWKTDSDTETLLALMILLGPKAALRKVRGMFAFCLFDKCEFTLTIGRDVFGEKPLYFGTQPNAAFLSSELSALHQMPGLNLQIDQESAAQFVQYGYIPEPNSIFGGIHKLPPGHFATLKTKTKNLSFVVERYDQPTTVAVDTSLDVNVATFDTMLTDTIQQALVADVPLGIFLSGGIDSSLVTALLAKQTSQPLKTFTVGFPNPAFDESSKALQIAKLFGTDHTTIDIDLTDFADAIAAIPGQFSEPFADPSQVPTSILCQKTNKHLTVALTGDGGDELFMGYNRHQTAITIWHWWRRLPALTQRLLMPLVNGPFDDFTSKILQIVNSTLPKKLHQKNLENKITKARSILGARDALELLQLLTVSGPIRDQPVLGYQGSGLTLPKIKSDLPLGQAFALHDQQNYLPSNVLVKSDRCGMAHKLELRAPFLSAALRDFANSLPISHKIHNGQGKYILRKLLENQTPKDISTAPKAGFDTPLTSWLINDLGTLVNDTLARENIERYNVLDANIVNARVAELYQGRVQNAQWVWNVFSLQRWQEKWMQ